MNTELVPVEPLHGARLGDKLPEVGEYYWVKDDETGDEELMCVEHVASNHVEFEKEGPKWTSSCKVRICELLASVRPAPEWREVIQVRMAQTQLAMEDARRELLADAVRKGALPAGDAPPCDVTDTSCMLPAVRVTDPAKQKRDLVALKERLPKVVESIGTLAKEYAAHAKALVLPEMLRLRAMQKRLKVVEDKIFTLEVYAGLQEEVLQIATGEPAPVGEPICVRQTMLFMDEETLFDYDKGGMDFDSVEAFDAWVAQPETLARILPEPKGIVAFRIRRNPKDYGIPKSLWEAWGNMEKDVWNMETYLVIRNGGNVYRICSQVDFSPRLVPLRSEFDDAFTETERGWHREPDITKRITPADLDYDEHRDKLQERLKHYNRIVVLIQGLLDRSAVFQPCPTLNLSSEEVFAHWLRFIRDEEDGIARDEETWVQYRDRLSLLIAKGKHVFTGGHSDLKRRGYGTPRMPTVCVVVRVRAGRAEDAIPGTYVRGGGGHDGRKEKEYTGIPGVDVSWPQGTRTGYEFGDHGRYGDWPTDRHCRAWIPIHELFNVTDYKPGDYKRFLMNRKTKAEYLTWAPALLTAEKFHKGESEGLVRPRRRY